MLKIDGLTFGDLRQANLDRLPHFKNNLGQPVHTTTDGSDWSLGEWCTAVTGELGEAANIIKKIKRGDMTLESGSDAEQLADELADVAIYLDILAYRAGISLSEAVIRKWNKTSTKVVGFGGRITNFGYMSNVKSKQA